MYWMNIDKPTKKCTIHSHPQCGYLQDKTETPHKGIGELKRDGGWLQFNSVDEATRYHMKHYADYTRSRHC